MTEYFSRNFKPRKSIMDKLDAKTKQKAVEEAMKKLQFWLREPLEQAVLEDNVNLKSASSALFQIRF